MLTGNIHRQIGVGGATILEKFPSPFNRVTHTKNLKIRCVSGQTKMRKHQMNTPLASSRVPLMSPSADIPCVQFYETFGQFLLTFSAHQ